MQKTTRKRRSGVGLIAVCSIVAAVALCAIVVISFILHSAFTPPEPVKETVDPSVDEPDQPTIARVTGSYNFLLLGSDKSGNLTDVIMIMNFDTVNEKISFVQLPRDTYVEYNGRGSKLNVLYSKLRAEIQNDNEAERRKATLDKLRAVLANALNIKLDYYAMVDLNGFDEIVDHIGGVEIDLPYDLDYDDPYQDLYIHLKQGHQILNGEQAEGFVRYRYGYALADIGRIDAQKIFMSAFIRQVKNSMNVSTAVSVAGDVYKYVVTSMPLSDCIYFVKNALSVDMENVHMMSMLGNGYKGGVYYIMCRESMYNMMNTYFNVLTEPIPEQYFDTDRMFVDPENAEMLGLYNSPAPDNDKTVRSADDINESGIYIPLDPNKYNK